ncbi:MAG: 4Fe-4S dicluster domain-containing protein, partial [bacterium]
MKFEKNEVKLPLEPQNKVIFAIRPCDAFGLEILAQTFLQDPVDPYFAKRREETIFISLACKNPLPTCFCTSFDGFDPYKRYGADILLYKEEKGYLVLDVSEKGKEMVNGWQKVEHIYSERVSETKRSLLDKLNKQKVKTENLKDRLLSRFNDIGFWENHTMRCINCGICTYLCPTCYCFDIDDERIKSRVRRTRIWDSCQFAYFTLEASGHNPRQHKLSRTRQRFMHKLSYFPTTYKNYHCVGCGRCIIYCPVNIDIREIITSA